MTNSNREGLVTHACVNFNFLLPTTKWSYNVVSVLSSLFTVFGGYVRNLIKLLINPVNKLFEKKYIYLFTYAIIRVSGEIKYTVNGWIFIDDTLYN